jgi:hypothetical protein
MGAHQADGDNDNDAQWNRIALELLAYREKRKNTWGDIDDLTLARFLGGETSEEETARVNRAMADYPKVRECVAVLRDVLLQEAWPLDATIEPPESISFPGKTGARTRQWLSPLIRVAAAACVMIQVPWVAMGASAGVSLAVVGLGALWLLSGPKTETPKPTAPTSASSVAQKSQPQPGNLSPLVALATSSKTGAVPRTSLAPSPKAAASAASRDDDGPSELSAPLGHDAPIEAIKEERTTGLTPSPTEIARTNTASQGMPPPQVPQTKPAADGSADLDLSQLKSAKGSVALDKLLKNPSLYANQMVALARAYCIGNVCTIRPDGSVSLPMREGMLDLKFDGRRASIHTLRSTLPEATVQVDIDPKLAAYLAGRNLLRQTTETSINPAWGENVAIVTVGVVKRGAPAAGQWTPCIVKFEFLVDIGPQVVTVAKKRKRKVVYKTLTLTRDRDQTGEGKAEDWAQQERLLHIANQYKDIIENQARQLSDAKWNMFNNQINSMVTQGMRNAAIPPAEPPRPRRVFP